MGWIAKDAADRARGEHGTFYADEWWDFAVAAGIRCHYEDLPPWLPAARVDDRVFIRRGMTERETARWAWHEIGHVYLHPGNWLYWESLPMGDMILSKQERQADEFASAFPVWGDTP